MSIATELARDACYALRTLAKTPGVTAVIVLTVALGIGATTAIFSVVNSVLLQPLPYAEPERLVRIVEHVPAEENNFGVARRKRTMNQDEFDWWRQRSQTLSHMAMVAPDSRTLQTLDGTALLSGARVSPALFAMRGVQPMLGRGLLPEEERPDATAIVISESTWRRYFDADPEIVGKTVVLNGQANEIVGVMPPTFGDEAFWAPLFEPPGQPGRIFVADVSARLRDGVTLEAASAEANVLGLQLRGLTQEPPDAPRFEVVRELDEIVGPVVPALRVLVVAVVVVLLIVCTNVANLLLARSTDRQSEIGIRRSLGATRGRIVRQVVTESFVLAGLSGLAGVGLAYLGVELLKDLSTISLSGRFSRTAAILPRIEEIALDPLVLGFVAGVSVLTGALFGVLPALRAAQFGEIGRTSNSRSTALRGHQRLRNTLATVQIAFAMALLVGAGLLMHSFLKLAAVDVGFDGRNVLSFDLVIPGNYTAERKLRVAEEIAQRLSEDRRVSSIGYTDVPPLQPAVNYTSDFIPAGYTVAEIREEQANLPSNMRTQSRYVSPGYLPALGTRLLSGRWLDEEQGSTSGLTAIVSSPFAQHYFPGRNPIGETMTSRFGELTIIGVVDSIRMLGMDAEPERAVFLEPSQILAAQQGMVESGRLRQVDRDFLTPGTGGSIAFALRSSVDPLVLVGEIRSVVSEIEPQVAVDNAMTMEEVLSGIMTRPRFYAVLLSLFGGVAAFLALIGIYGVLAYVVGLRTNEIGIRIALGAPRLAVLGLVLRQGGWMIVIGTGAGLAGAVLLSRYLEGMLFGLTSLDLTTYVLVASSFVAVALFAAYVPASRATRLDPLVALRYE